MFGGLVVPAHFGGASTSWNPAGDAAWSMGAGSNQPAGVNASQLVGEVASRSSAVNSNWKDWNASLSGQNWAPATAASQAWTAPAAPNASNPAASNQVADNKWRSELQRAYMKANKKISKGEIKYFATQVTLDQSGATAFQAQVTIAGQTFAGNIAQSKKEAEEEAAYVAVEALFPDRDQPQQKQQQKSKASPPPLLPGDFKKELMEAFKVFNGKYPSKDEVTYATQEVVDGAGTAAYQSQVTVQGTVFAGETASNKKAAEQNAAKEALQNLYPAQSELAQAQAALVPPAKIYGGNDGNGSGENHPKSRLMRALNVILGRNPEKKDLDYQFEEGGRKGSKYTCTLTIVPLEASFQGTPEQNKKNAEASAAQVAVDSLSGQGQGQSVTNWKLELAGAHGKAHDKVMQPHEIVFEHWEVHTDTEAKQFQAQVSFDGMVYAGELASSGELAEQSAAKVALQELYPEVVAPLAPPEGEAKGKGSGKRGGKKGSGKGSFGKGRERDTDWKRELNFAYRKFSEKEDVKDDIQYSMADVVDETTGSVAFQCEVIVAGSTFNGPTAHSKRKAEQDAAAVALRELFPEHVCRGGVTLEDAKQKSEKIQKVQKRKAGEVFIEEMHPKSRLLHGVTVLLQKTPTKDDVVFTVEDAPHGFLARLTIPDLNVSYVGEIVATKKLAETSVAEVALRELSDQIEPAVADHQETKKAKIEEKRIETQARRESVRQERMNRRAAKSAGKGAKGAEVEEAVAEVAAEAEEAEKEGQGN
eukprot:TRINITY_DN10804_c0_g1_i1.p1 TRINITY_DN10804_c0_g1~~TRINITY_DN10804_c0_g1_i1.p1  ORF type:complete len:760 (-),score=163.75 TRINITY_DN10804_c0_g1_i1:57-2336(-)